MKGLLDAHLANRTVAGHDTLQKAHVSNDEAIRRTASAWRGKQTLRDCTPGWAITAVMVGQKSLDECDAGAARGGEGKLRREV